MKKTYIEFKLFSGLKVIIDPEAIAAVNEGDMYKDSNDKVCRVTEVTLHNGKGFEIGASFEEVTKLVYNFS